MQSKLARVLHHVVRAIGLVLFSAIGLVLVLNFAIKPYLLLSENMGQKRGKAHKPSDPPALLAEVYPGKSPDIITGILHDTRESRPPGPLEPCAPVFSSRNVNMVPAGYRLIDNQMPFSTDPEKRNVFVFGGSTVWGYGLPDGETIASHLQHDLNNGRDPLVYHVFNYGVCASYTKYEKRHLERLIHEGMIPDHVVFIDGLNEFCRIPLDRPKEDEDRGQRIPPLLLRWIVEPTRFWCEQFGGGKQIKDMVVEYDDSDLERACEEMAGNWIAIQDLCKAHGFRSTLVLQPIPVYDYALEESLFLSEADLLAERSYYLAARKGYGMLLEENRLHGVTYLDLHQLRCDGYEYLDTCHYTSAFASEIARHLANTILSKTPPSL